MVYRTEYFDDSVGLVLKGSGNSGKLDSFLRALMTVLSRRLKQRDKTVNRDLEACMTAMGIKKDITFHCSRHTFAINCILLGIDIITVRNWLGHASVVTTEIYAKIAQQYKDESMKKWDNFGKLKVA